MSRPDQIVYYLPPFRKRILFVGCYQSAWHSYDGDSVGDCVSRAREERRREAVGDGDGVGERDFHGRDRWEGGSIGLCGGGRERGWLSMRGRVLVGIVGWKSRIRGLLSCLWSTMVFPSIRLHCLFVCLLAH